MEVKMDVKTEDLMWKNSYCIGVEHLDRQHKELFQMVKDLLEIVEDEMNWLRRRSECRTEVLFLKTSFETHFKEEESYQQSIDYPAFDVHKKMHDGFMKELLEHELLMMSSGFDRKEVKQFCGMLVSWLVYHVVEIDQRMAQKGQNKDQAVTKAFVKSLRDTLETMVGLNSSIAQDRTDQEARLVGDAFVRIDIIGDIRGSVVYGFSRDFALEVVRMMTFMELTELDDMVCSAMGEISNITSGNATISLAEKGYQCDITTPAISIDEFPSDIGELTKGVCLESSVGQFSFCAVIQE